MPLTSLTSTINPSQLNKNYIPNGQLETNSTAGWSLFTTTLTSGLPTGTLSAGASSLSLSTTATTPLFQTYSLVLAGSGAVTAGQGLMSDPFTIDRVDLAKPLTFRIYYEAISGATNANWSGIVGSQSFAIYLYDVTNSAWVQPAGAFGMNQSVGPGYVTGTFQTSSTSGQQYRLVLMCLQATTGAISLEIDEVSVTPQTAPIGSVTTDWIDFPSVAAGTLITGTGSNPSYGTTTVNKAQWRRVGDSMEIFWEFKQTTGGTIGSGSYLFSLPAGYSIDTNKVVVPASAIDGYTSLGSGHIASGTTYGTMSATAYNSTKLALFVLFDGMGALAQNWGQTQFNLGSNPLVISFNAKVPIAGWGSNVQLSNDTDTRVVAARATKSANQNITTTGNTQITWNTYTIDTHGGFSGNTYTVPVSGIYRISLTVDAANIVSGGAGYVVTFFSKNGTSLQNQYYYTNNNETFGTNSGIFQLVAGDQITAFAQSPDGNYDIRAGNSFISLERLSGPSVVAATESVNASYGLTATQTVNNGVRSYVDFPNRAFDTHSMYIAPSGAYNAASGSWATSQPSWIVPVSGKYSLTATVLVGNMPGLGQSSYRLIEILKNGTQIKGFQTSEASAGTYNNNVLVSGIVQLNAGDVLTVRCEHQTGANRIVGAGAGSNYFDIYRIGN